jgi:hypothetical protein
LHLAAYQERYCCFHQNPPLSPNNPRNHGIQETELSAKIKFEISIKAEHFYNDQAERIVQAVEESGKSDLILYDLNLFSFFLF